MSLKNIQKTILLSTILIMLFTLNTDLGQSLNCRIEPHDSFNNASYTLTGYVSTQGYYSNNLSTNIKYPYGLFCDSSLILNRTDGVASFNFSDPLQIVATTATGENIHGSGMATATGNTVTFVGEAKQGFTNCHTQNGACAKNETCVVKISNADVGVIADCNQDIPYANSFPNTICCGAKEYCRDGIDNDGDTYIDCADPDCHPDPSANILPQRCDPDPSSVPGNNQRTDECVSTTINTEPGNQYDETHCVYVHPFEGNKLFYCSYGEDDNPTTSTGGEGYCCPEGKYYDENRGECRDFTKCGTGAAYFCDYKFSEGLQWFNQVYDGVNFKWCNSKLPLFTNNIDPSIFRSEACCPVVIHGTFDYFIVDENVKIYGYK